MATLGGKATEPFRQTWIEIQTVAYQYLNDQISCFTLEDIDWPRQNNWKQTSLAAGNTYRPGQSVRGIWFHKEDTSPCKAVSEMTP